MATRVAVIPRDDPSKHVSLPYFEHYLGRVKAGDTGVDSWFLPG